MVTRSQAAVEQLQTVTQIAALSMVLIEGNHPMWRHCTDMVKNCDHQIYPGLHTFFCHPPVHTHTHTLTTQRLLGYCGGDSKRRGTEEKLWETDRAQEIQGRDPWVCEVSVYTLNQQCSNLVSVTWLSLFPKPSYKLKRGLNDYTWQGSALLFHSSRIITDGVLGFFPFRSQVLTSLHTTSSAVGHRLNGPLFSAGANGVGSLYHDGPQW